MGPLLWQEEGWDSALHLSPPTRGHTGQILVNELDYLLIEDEPVGRE